MRLKDLLPSEDLDEMFALLDAKDHWLLLIVDFQPVTAIIGALSKMMLHPPKSYRVTGLPAVIALPKKDISTKALASIMSTAGGGSDCGRPPPANDGGPVRDPVRGAFVAPVGN